MVDTVATQTLLDGERLVIQKFTNISDGTGETAVNKVIVANLAPNFQGIACSGVKINKIWVTTHGLEVRMLWDATTDVFAWMVPQNTNYFMDFSEFGGLTNNSGTGKTGNIAFTTADASAGDMYSIVLECIKTYGCSMGRWCMAKGGATPVYSDGGAWTRAEGKNPEGGLNEKGRASLRSQGHDIKRPVSSSEAKKSPAAAGRRDSFCSRMKGMKAKLTSAETARDPDSRINKALRKWDC